MIPLPRYGEYVQWGGQLAEEDFAEALPRAAGRVRQRLAAVDMSGLSEEEHRACIGAVCAAADALSDDTAGLASYSAGKVSATFASSAYRANTVEAAIERELSGTRLIGTAV